MSMQSSSRARGSLSVRHIPFLHRPTIASLDDAVRYGTPSRRVPFWDRAAAKRRAWQRDNEVNFERSIADQGLWDAGILRFIGHLWLAKVTADGDLEDLGLVSCRVVTDTGVGFIVDAFQGLTTMANMKYHGLGTGTTAEAATQTALVTELTTQYASANTRPTGSTGEKSGDSKTYETAATITVSAGVAATEHGVFSQAATGGGVMLDRSVFSVVNLGISESIQATYQFTLPSGS